MPWYIFGLGSALISAFGSIVEKKMLVRNSPATYAVTYAFLNFCFGLPLIFFTDFTTITPYAIFIMYLTTLGSSIGFICVVEATKYMEVSEVSVLLLLDPGVTALLGGVMLGEFFSWNAMGGIILLIIGVYIARLRGHHGLFDPLKRIFKSKYVQIVLFGILAYAIGSQFGRFAIHGLKVPILTFLFFLQTGLFLNIFLWDILRPRKSSFKTGKLTAKELLTLSGVSILTIASRLMQIQATRMVYAAFVTATKNTSAFFVELFAGRFMGEKNIGRKIIGTCVMIAGTIIIIYSS